MKKWKIQSNTAGVSEVIGTILLLSISVTLFSVVYISVLSFPGAPSTPSSNIAISLNETSVIITHVSGEPLSLDSQIKVMIDDTPHIYNVAAGLNETEKHDNYWGFGEQFELNFSDIGITEDLVEYAIEVTVIDVDSNSIVMMGKKIITDRPPIIGFPYNTSKDISIDISQLQISISDPDNDAFTWWINCSNGQSAYASGASNGIKTLSLPRLKVVTLYTIWVNATDPTGSGLWTRRWYTFTTEGNYPPTYGIPLPQNGSMGNALNFNWGIPINDREGDHFTWTITCSNGQTESSNGVETDGTKSLSLSGLAYLTTYKVWVNATDPLSPNGSGLWTREWYTFTTKGNYPPAYGTPSPVNDSRGNQLTLTWSIPIIDPEGHSFNWSIQCSNGFSYSAVGASNGNKSLPLSGLAYSTTYTVWVNATDPTPEGSGLWTRRWYTFTTKERGNPPIFGTPSPTNGSTGQPGSLTWSIPINDPEGNLFNWTIKCSNGQTISGTGASNGIKSLTLSGLAGGKTTYKVWVNATDPTGSNLYTRKWYVFTTKQTV